ncbi:MAG: polysaccharide deacetylase family protein [Phycisphaeraceae bacterium]|nr:polysaccharide deacetylase family protein [Phycisphaerales bacterium]MCB9859840.1 polysaccharide deacetylase family protein [Phycisphaeraceae bacterium]
MPDDPSQRVHALSFDIEDWFHIVEVKAVEDPSQWPKLSAESSLVERYTDLILRICDDAKTHATFFILGWIADKHPALVKRIADAGHEIGSHSFWHRKVYELDPDIFRDDLQQANDAIRSAAGAETSIAGFRAPSFSITQGAEWAFDTLIDLGFTYDASLFPAARGHGGYACEPGPHVVTAPSGRQIPELPMSIAPVGIGPIKKRMCYSGGGYLRLLPIGMIEQGIASESVQDRSTVVYLHPRDFAPDCPRVPMPPHRRFKCYVGAASTEAKLRHMLTHHRWTTCADVLARSGTMKQQETETQQRAAAQSA